MKKLKGTRYAHITRSWNPAMDEQLDKMEQELKEQRERLDKLIAKINNMLRE